MVKRTEAIKKFLLASTYNDLASLYEHNMEVQVLVAQDNGQRVDGEFRGKNWVAYTDGLQYWKSFRIPYKANTVPEYEDRDMTYDLALHAEGIGMTGWNWVARTSKWVGFDFDSISGHKHQKKLTEAELEEVKDRVSNIEWVTVRKSTSGKGLHLYVFLPDIPTANHNEHAALARAVLSMMSAISGFDFYSRVDACGGVLWQWHRKMQGTDGLSLLKQGSVYEEVPDNWRDHVPVVTGAQKKIRPFFVKGEDFDEISGKQAKVELDEEHRQLINWLIENNARAWWDSDHHCLVTHTTHLKDAHSELSMRGVFETISTGKEHGQDHNVFAHPIRRGAWVVRRFTPGTAEHDTWTQDPSGWTKCYLNRDPDLDTASRAKEGLENVKGGYNFKTAEQAQEAANMLGANVDLPPWVRGRRALLKKHKDGRLIFEIDREADDTALPSWSPEKGKWLRIFNVRVTDPIEAESIGQFDDVVRHLVSEDGVDCGWVIRSDSQWRSEPLTHVKHALASLGYGSKEITVIVGTSTLQCWTLVNKPFEPEYPEGRQWNRNAAQFRFKRSEEIDNLIYPTWQSILTHCGSGLDEAVQEDTWCKSNGILTGSDYLKCWIASLLQEPNEPLPYLFFYGEQMTGKSVFHEAISLLVTHGVVRADTALMTDFNGELANAILCVVEETDLQRSVKASNRIKDWVTSRELLVHAKNQTPYTIPNTTHWTQCSNSHLACPVFPGDTRVTMIQVPKIKNIIPKKLLFQRLEKEAPDFLAELLTLELPPSPDRLNLPVVTTAIKKLVEDSNRTTLEVFVAEKTYARDGQAIKFSEFYEAFISWIDPADRHYWTKIRVGKEMSPKYPKGRLTHENGQWYLGNISFEPGEHGPTRYVVREDKLVLVEKE